MSAYVVFDVESRDAIRYRQFMQGGGPALEAAGGVRPAPRAGPARRIAESRAHEGEPVGRVELRARERDRAAGFAA